MAIRNKSDNENTNQSESNNKNTPGSVVRGTAFFIIRHPFISLLIAIALLAIMAGGRDLIIVNRGKENPNDSKNAPAAINGFINNVYLDENGNLKMEKSMRQLWEELEKNGNTIIKELNSPEELAKLVSASMVTDYPDLRKNPDEPIDWNNLDTNIDSTDVQGIVKFKRALQNGETITMTYLPQEEFQAKINEYNELGEKKDREEALKYFTLEKIPDTGSTGYTGYVDIGSRSLNNDPLEASEQEVDIHKKTNNLFNKQFDAVQSASFDGKYIICSANAGKHGHHGGRVFWIDIQTGNVLPNYVTIGSEGNHMTGQTYDCDRKVVLVTSVGNKRLIQIDNQTKQMMSTRYVNIPRYFHVITYSPTTKQLIGYRNKKLTFMTYDPNENSYKEDTTVTLSGSFNFPLQGMSTDGQVIYFLDSTNSSSKKDKFRVWVYDFQGNLIEEHKIGDSFRSTASEVEDCFCDKEGNLWLVMPYEATKIRNYKANPVDWENGYSPMSSQMGTGATGGTTAAGTTTSTAGTTGSSTNITEILKYACSWVGKIKYKKAGDDVLKEGAKEDCGGFVHNVYRYFELMSPKYHSPKKWENGAPGTEEVGKDLANASPGDVTWRKGSDGRCHVSIYLGKGKRVHCTPGGRSKYWGYF